MPQRERINVNFGFAPTRPQQGVFDTYAPPVKQGSADAEMYDAIAKLSGTFMSDMLSTSQAKTKAEIARLNSWNSLTSEQKEEFNSKALQAARLHEAGKTDEAQKIMDMYAGAKVKEGLIPFKHHRYFTSRFKGHKAVLELDSAIESHLTPEVLENLTTQDIDIEDYLIRLTAGSLKDGDNNPIDLGLSPETQAAMGNPLVQGLITKKISTLAPQLESQQDSNLQDQYVTAAQSTTATIILENIKDPNLAEQDLFNASLSKSLIETATQDFKIPLNEAGFKELIPAFQNNIDLLIKEGDFDEALKILNFTGVLGQEGVAIHGNKSFYDIDPDSINALHVKYITRKQSFEKELEANENAKQSRLTRKLNLEADALLYDLRRETFGSEDYIAKRNVIEETFENLLTDEKSDYTKEVESIPNLKAALLLDFSEKLQAFENNKNTTSNVFKFSWANKVESNQETSTLRTYLDDSFKDGLVSTEDFLTRSRFLHDRDEIADMSKKYNNQYLENTENFNGRIKGALQEFTNVETDLIGKILSSLAPTDAGRYNNVMESLKASIRISRNQKRRDLFQERLNSLRDDEIPEKTLEDIKKDLDLWEDALIQGLVEGRFENITPLNFYDGDGADQSTTLEEAYKNLNQIGMTVGGN
tara:strand:+ start:1205 stop:3142 length:1938 start_codon:yes stop_codon:yes gene_type:complete